jgi:NADH-quinone oxidoreductase subunit J
MLRMPIFADELLPILFVGAGCLFIGSIILISSQTNPIYAVFSFILAALSAFFLLILLGAEFFALLILIIYIGVITILFLFVVFMYNLRVLTKFTF